MLTHKGLREGRQAGREGRIWLRNKREPKSLDQDKVPETRRGRDDDDEALVVRMGRRERKAEEINFKVSLPTMCRTAGSR